MTGEAIASPVNMLKYALDEASFHLDGRVNSQNLRFWSTALPDVVAEAPLHSAKCTAFCAISSSGVIGPRLWCIDMNTIQFLVRGQRWGHRNG